MDFREQKLNQPTNQPTKKSPENSSGEINQLINKIWCRHIMTIWGKALFVGSKHSEHNLQWCTFRFNMQGGVDKHLKTKVHESPSAYTMITCYHMRWGRHEKKSARIILVMDTHVQFRPGNCFWGKRLPICHVQDHSDNFVCVRNFISLLLGILLKISLFIFCKPVLEYTSKGIRCVSTFKKTP